MRYLLILLLFPFWIKAQEITIHSKMDNETAFERNLKAFDRIVYYDFDFVSDSEKILHFQIIEKEFLNGTLNKEKVYFDTKSIPEQMLSNKIPISLFSKYVKTDNYRMLINLSKDINLIRNFEIQENDKYSFKIFINQAQKFKLNETYLFAGIIKPIKINETTYRNCDFNSAIDQYEKWYDVFELDHYYIYEIKFY